MGRAAVVLAAFALAAAACTGSATETTIAPAATSTTVTSPPSSTSSTTSTTTTTVLPPTPRGGTIVVGSDQEPPTLNPFLPGGDVPIVDAIAAATMARVWEIEPATRRPAPVIVEDLPSLRNGGLRIAADGGVIVRYDIRPEAAWADGTPISGDDFLFTYRTVMDPALPTDKSGFDVIDPEAIVVNPKSFIFKMAVPSPDAATLFRHIIPKHDVDGSDFTADWNDTMWVAGGPFRLAEWKLGDSLTLVRNDAYWETDPATGQPLPNLDRVVFRFIPETASLIEALQAGEVQTAQVPPAAELIASLNRDSRLTVDREQSPIWEHLAFRFGADQVDHPDTVASLTLREALARAVDRTAIARAVSGAVPLASPLRLIAPETAAQGWDRYPSDPEKARGLLHLWCLQKSRDCSTDPPQLTITLGTNNDTRLTAAAVLAEQLQAAGFAVNVQPVDYSIIDFGPDFCSEVYDTKMWAWRAATGLGGLVKLFAPADPSLPCRGADNQYRWGMPDPLAVSQKSNRFADLMATLRNTADWETGLGLAAEMEDILADEIVFIPLYTRPSYAAYRPDELSGFVHNPFGVDTWNVAHWFRPDL